MIPNIPKPKSRGRISLTSADPEVKPALDFRYFTDEDDYDAQARIDGIKIAREAAKTEPPAHWIKREVCPGPDSTSDEEISEYARKVAHTVYHPAGGLDGTRIADASVFPTMPAANPMSGGLRVGEKCADLLTGSDVR